MLGRLHVACVSLACTGLQVMVCEERHYFYERYNSTGDRLDRMFRLGSLHQLPNVYISLIKVI